MTEESDRGGTACLAGDEGANRPTPKRPRVNSNLASRPRCLTNDGLKDIEMMDPHDNNTLVETSLRHQFDICDPALQDLIVELTAEDRGLYRYRVSTTALAATSPVFKKMVDPISPMPSIETRGGEEYPYLPLHDDDPLALLVLLHAIHLRPELLLSHLTFKQLVSLAVICDKYDCTGPIWPYRKRWSDQWASKALEAGNEAWLYICVTLGDARYFRELTKDILLNLVITGSLESGDLKIWREGRSLDTGIFPDRIIVDMLEQRQKFMIFLHSECRKFIEVFEDATEFKSWNVNINFGPYFLRYKCIDACAGACYGAFMLGLRTKLIWRYLLEHDHSDPNIEINHLSPTDFLKAIKAVLKDATEAMAKVDHTGFPFVVQRMTDDKCGLYKYIEHILEKFDERFHLCGLEAREYQRGERSGIDGYCPEEWETFKIQYTLSGLYGRDRLWKLDSEKRLRNVQETGFAVLGGKGAKG